MALFAGAATLAIALLGAVANYIDNYYTTSVGQWVANDLRLRVYEHLHRLSLRYYDHANMGALVSTITSDVATIQDFASSSTLDIVIDVPHHLFHGRPDVLAGVGFHAHRDRVCARPAGFRFPFQEDLEGGNPRGPPPSKRSVVDHSGRIGLDTRHHCVRSVQDLEMAHLQAASHATVAATLRARKIKSLISPVVSIVVAICTAIVLWRRLRSSLPGRMTAGALTVYLAYFKNFFKPVKDLAEHDQHVRTGHGRVGTYSIDPVCG